MSSELFYDKDTIVALATASGRGALAIVRVSGPSSTLVIEKCFSPLPETLESHKAYYGLWKDPLTQTLQDEVLVLYFDEGRGFTGEKSFEIMCHGGSKVVELLTESCIKAGARLARPGEFTFRAVMNGKLDLIQAESILDIIDAKTNRAVSSSLENLRGALSEEVFSIEKEIVFLLANLEASIDFTTEDIQPVDNQVMSKKAGEVVIRIQKVLDSYVFGRIIQGGIKVALVGKPNAGKSSLLNRLVGEEKAIVTEVAGTTRDLIEVEKVVAGILFRFVDTAGIRETTDRVETVGVRLATEAMEKSDFAVHLIDLSEEVERSDIQRTYKTEPSRSMVVLNKMDLLETATLKRKQTDLAQALDNYRVISISAKTGEGLSELLKAISTYAQTQELPEQRALLTNLRQKQGLELASSALQKSINLMEQDASPEIISHELSEAHRCIEEVLGRSIKTDIMDRVFKEFCIGK